MTFFFAVACAVFAERYVTEWVVSFVLVSPLVGTHTYGCMDAQLPFGCGMVAACWNQVGGHRLVLGNNIIWTFASPTEYRSSLALVCFLVHRLSLT